MMLDKTDENPRKKKRLDILSKIIVFILGLSIGIWWSYWYIVYNKSNIYMIGVEGIGIFLGLLLGIFLGTVFIIVRQKNIVAFLLLVAAVLLYINHVIKEHGYQQDPIIIAINGLAIEYDYNTNYYINQLVSSGERAIPELIKVLRSDPRPIVRKRSIIVLGDIGKPASEAIPVLLRLIQSREGENMGYYAMKALISIAPDSYYIRNQIIKVCSAEKQDPVVKKWAMQVLDSIGKPAGDAVPTLLKYCNSKEGYLGFNVMEDLCKIAPDSPEIRSRIIEICRIKNAINSDELPTSLTLFQRATLLRRVCAPPELVNAAYIYALKNSARQEREFLIYDIEKYKEPSQELIRAILSYIQNPNISTWEVYRYSEYLFNSNIDSNLVIQTLLEKLEVGNYQNCIDISECLGKYGPLAKQAIPILRELSVSGRGDGEWNIKEVKEAATKALQKIEEPSLNENQAGP